jgi:hypothetical protein
MEKLKNFIGKILSDYTSSSPIQKPKADSDSPIIRLSSEIYTLITLLEKCLMMGLFQCINSLLYILCVMPIKTLTSPSRVTIFRTLILFLVSFQVSYMMSVSRLYHDLKEQDFLKLNFVYNMIGVADQLLMAFGQKCMKTMTSSLENLIITVIYVWLHSMHLSLAITVFEVALNSSKYNLLLVIMTSAFVELKITVFKKHDKKVLMNVINNDIVERLQVFIYMFTLFAKAIINRRSNVDELVNGILIILSTYFVIDWVKHYFVLHFNGMQSSVYQKIYEDMKDNWTKTYTTGGFFDGDKVVENTLDPSCSLTLNYKFMALPQACMVRDI